MRRGLRVRAGALLLAVLVQVAGVAVLLLERQGPRPNEAEPMLIHIEPLLDFTPVNPQAELVPPEGPEEQPRRRITGVATVPVVPIEAPLARPAPGSDRSITPAPDWYAGAPGAAARLVEKEVAAESNPLDSKPQVMELPERPVEEERAVRMGNGDLQFRTGDLVCTYSDAPQGLRFNEWARHLPANCAYKPRPKSTFAQEFDKKLQEKRPAYLKSKPPERLGTASNAIEEPQ